jgi:haloalkane dehalogenase
LPNSRWWQEWKKNSRRSQLAEINPGTGQIADTAGKVGIFTAAQTLRTPDERFAEIPNFRYSPRYCELDDYASDRVRVASIEDGPADADPVLLLHGEPSWSFLSRTMIPALAAAGQELAGRMIAFLADGAG